MQYIWLWRTIRQEGKRADVMWYILSSGWYWRERIHQTSRGQDQTLWSLLGNSFNSYQIIPPQLPAFPLFPGRRHVSQIQWDKLVSFKKGSCPIFSFAKLQLSHSQPLWQKTEEQIRAEKWQSAKRSEMWMRKTCTEEGGAINLESAAQRACHVRALEGREVHAQQNLHHSINVWLGTDSPARSNVFHLHLLALQRGYCFSFTADYFIVKVNTVCIMPGQRK